MDKEIYRGYDIEPHTTEGFIVKKDGKVISSQPSKEFCYSFIDKHKRVATWLAQMAQR